MTWTDQDQTRAARRGWFISPSTGIIRAVDETHDSPASRHLFNSDRDAAVSVINRAFTGDRLCRKAVRAAILHNCTP